MRTRNVGAFFGTVALFALVTCSAACSKDCGGGGDGATTSTPLGATASAIVSARVHRKDAAPAAKDEGRKLSNLLYTTEATVAVSSKVDNPKDFPEHLIDGKLDTAWNGKTGDLKGWIAFRIPKAAHVAFVAMTAGFDKGDLFTKNHRIKKVRVLRDGVKLAEVSLDIEKRGPQKIPIDADGGEVRIEVLETEPGTKPEWKELTVSELAVWGDPKSARIAVTQTPRVTVGSFNAPKAKKITPEPDTTKTFEAYCADFEKLATPLFLAVKDDYPGFIAGPYCTLGDPLVAKPPAPFLEIRSVGTTDTSARTSHVGIRTKKGIFLTEIHLGVEDLRNPGCAGGCDDRVKSTEIVTTPKGPALVSVVDQHCWNNPWPGTDGSGDRGTPGSSTYKERAEICTVSATDDVVCTQYEVSTTEAKFREYENDFQLVPWSSPKKRRTLPTGELVFE